jgi:hypothetical protein
MGVLNIKVTLELDPEATVVATASVNSIEKGQVGLTIQYDVVAAKVGKRLLSGKRLVADPSCKSITNEKNDPVPLVVPNNAEGRLIDFGILCQEFLQAAYDCGEIPAVLTISPGI